MQKQQQWKANRAPEGGSRGGDETIGSQEEFWVSVKLSVRFNLSLHT